MSERATHMVYLVGGRVEDGDLFAQEVYPKKTILADAIRMPNAELIVNAADAHLWSFNQDVEPQWIECDVYDKEGNLIGRTPRRSPVYKYIAGEVAEMIGKEKVIITIR